jgi:uncharacterized protein YndB with AHSA1/START domain
MNDASRVLVAMRVQVSAERAFTAFTDQIGQWWRPNELFPFTPGKPGTMVFESGPNGRLVEKYDDGTEFVIGDVRAWEPPRRVVVGWRHHSFTAGQDTELHVRFDEIAGDDVQTRVTVEHFGWDRIPLTHAVRHGFPLAVFQLRFAEWWRAQLTTFAACVTSSKT